MFFLRKLLNVSRRYYHYRYYASMPSRGVRVRFAPSPTGFLHLGGLRTAFYNYLFAKKMRGSFLLRIEDTDQKRIVQGSVENLNKMLQWTGLIPDESPVKGGPFGPYVQSQRLEKYREKANDLLKSGAAYRCFCSETRLNILKKDALRSNESRGYDNKCRGLTPSDIQPLLDQKVPFIIRFKIPDKSITHDDIVYGAHAYNVSENEGDFIIIKSDGFPTYHFACVVDDHLMEISHVLRGTEWLISTPKHIMLHEAFNWKPPQFAHLPLLTNSDRTKLSKRQESIGVENFKNKGYSPEALLNFLAVAGGGFGKQEGCIVYDLKTLCSKFKLESLNTNSCIVDLRKLDLFNHNYLVQQLSNEETITKLIKEFRKILKIKFDERYKEEEMNLSDAYLRRILLCYKDRMNTLSELIESDMEYLWLSPKYECVMQLLSALKVPDSVVCTGVRNAKEQLSLIPHHDFTQKNLSSCLREISTHLKVKYVLFMMTLRVVLTGQKDGLGVAEMLATLGKERSLERLLTFTEEIDRRETKIFLD